MKCSMKLLNKILIALVCVSCIAWTPTEDEINPFTGEPDLIYPTLESLEDFPGEIDMEGFGIVNVESVYFDTAYSETGDEPIGTVFWDSDHNTPSFVATENATVLFNEPIYYVKNQTGSQVDKGTAVMFAGTIGASGRILIAPMIADGTYKSKYFMGLTIEDIPNGSDGVVLAFGHQHGIDTTGSLYGESWSDGDILYVSPTTAGYLTNVEPQAPDNIITVSAIVYAHTTGTLQVRPTWESKLQSLQDVNGDAPTKDGQVYLWDNVGEVFTLSTSTVDFNDQDVITKGFIGVGNTANDTYSEISQEYISGRPYVKIPDNQILGVASGNQYRLIDAKTTFNPPALVPASALKFEAEVVTSNFLTTPMAIEGRATITTAGFGAIPIIFDATAVNEQDVNNLFNAVGFSSSFQNNSDIVATLMRIGLLVRGSSQGKLPNSHNLGFVSERHGMQASSGQEAISGGFNVALYATEQTTADNNYSMVATGNTENNAIGLGGAGNAGLGQTPTDDIKAKVFYDNESLMVVSSLDAQGHIGLVGGVAVGDDSILGDEEVVNGDFAVGTDWTLTNGWSISGGLLVFTGTAGTATQTITGIEEGRMYKFTYTITDNDFTTGGWSNSPVITVSDAIFPRKYIADTYSHYFVASASKDLVFTSSGSHNYQIDDVSIKELKGGDLVVANDIYVGNELYLDNLAGTYTGGSAYLCIANSGTVFSSESACP